MDRFKRYRQLRREGRFIARVTVDIEIVSTLIALEMLKKEDAMDPDSVGEAMALFLNVFVGRQGEIFREQMAAKKSLAQMPPFKKPRAYRKRKNA
jgi:hypothetical protein